MYTNQELDSIVSRLSSLTAEELNYLKMKIDLILSQKKISALSRHQISLPKSMPQESTIMTVKPRQSAEKFGLLLESDIKAESEEERPAKKHHRPSGMWKGKVKMPDDFDELSNDILTDFSID